MSVPIAEDYEIPQGFTCPDCGFDIWDQVFENDLFAVGLYDDMRFPGRMIVMLKPHFDHFDEISEDLAIELTKFTQLVARIQRMYLGCDRVNQAILGNAVSHVHSHMIPRWPANEPKPNSPSWVDPRPKQPMTDAEKSEIMSKIRKAFDREMSKS